MVTAPTTPEKSGLLMPPIFYFISSLDITLWILHHPVDYSINYCKLLLANQAQWWSMRCFSKSQPTTATAPAQGEMLPHEEKCVGKEGRKSPVSERRMGEGGKGGHFAATYCKSRNHHHHHHHQHWRPQKTHKAKLQKPHGKLLMLCGNTNTWVLS